MLIESVNIRELLNTTLKESEDIVALTLPATGDGEKESEVAAPDHYEVSLNPIPALVILLLGIMMSSHNQDSAISTMVHKQWGNLLAGASFARGLTYTMIYLKPPHSVLPSRPPTELLAAFGLIAGGIIFMASVSPAMLTSFFLAGLKHGPMMLTEGTGKRCHPRHGKPSTRCDVYVYCHHGTGGPTYGMDIIPACAERLGHS